MSFLEGLAGKFFSGQQGDSCVAKSGKGRTVPLIDLAGPGSAAAAAKGVSSPWGKTVGLAKVNIYRKKIHVHLNSHAYDDANYHITRDQFLARCNEMAWAQDIHGWPRIIEYMEGNFNL